MAAALLRSRRRKAKLPFLSKLGQSGLTRSQNFYSNFCVAFTSFHNWTLCESRCKAPRRSQSSLANDYFQTLKSSDELAI
jgi:hypothetical protein